MPAFCGFDFGTSNTTIGIGKDNHCQLVTLENNKSTMRSAIFCDTELKKWIFGQEGVNSYLEGAPGRLMMSLKSVLGTSLMEDKTVIFNEYISYSSVLAHFMQHVKELAEQFVHSELTHVVLGRPVHFNDNDREKDRLAQNTLEKIARDIGFKEVSFQFEPIAAALTYEMSIKQEQLALIIDMGGGTSDFTIIRLHPGASAVNRSHDVLANCGIHIAGTDFDQRLSLNTVMPLLGMGSMMSGSSSDIEVPSMFYHDLTTWHTLSNLYDAKTLTHIRSIRARAYQKNLLDRLLHILKTKGAHHILDTVETSKQNLSDELAVNLNLDFIEHNLKALVKRQELNAVIHDDLKKIISTIQETIKISGVKNTDISALFFTGGSTKIPLIRDRITAMFPQAEVIQGDAFGSVGLGLTLEAQRKYR
ncbi:MAG: Hsp70 family protein [Gammaproteobacteria bacterium]